MAYAAMVLVVSIKMGIPQNVWFLRENPIKMI